MPYDPNFPPHGADIISAEFRTQFHGIKDLIDAGVPGPQGPAGPQGVPGTPGSNGSDGAQGPQGAPFASAVVDAVNTLNPGDNATVGTGFDGSNVHFTFGDQWLVGMQLTDQFITGQTGASAKADLRKP